MRVCLCILCALVLIAPITSIAATPGHFWSRGFGAAQNEGVTTVAVDPATGDIIAGGYFNLTVDFGGVTLTASTNTVDGWLARYNRKGELKWAKAFGGIAGNESVNALALDVSGNLFITGHMVGSVDFGGGLVTGGGSQDIFVVKLDANGGHVWSRALGGNSIENANCLAVDVSGSVLVGGSFIGSTNLGGGAIAGAGFEDVFIVKFNGSTSTWMWNIWAGSTSSDDMRGLAVDTSGNVYGTGFFSNTIVFNAIQPLVSAGALDMFLVKYNSSGTYQWSQRRGMGGDDIPLDLTVDASANPIVTGAYTGTTNLGGSNLPSTIGYSGFLAKYNTAGVHQWSTGFGGSSTDAGYGVRAVASGDIVFCGIVSTGTNLGGGVLPNAGSGDIFLARYTAAGAHVGSRAAGGFGDDSGFCLALDAGENAVVGGVYRSIADFGGGNLPYAGVEDAFLAKYGIAEPVIDAITDIGNDQGRSVRIALARSGMDDGTADLPIEEYQAFRRILPLPSNLAAADTKRAGDAPQAAPPGNWEFVASVPASNAEMYFMVAPTLADSTIAEGQYRTTFFVRAATAEPSVFFDSAPDSGYSVDNLAPAVPQNFVYAAGALSWDESPAADFDYFSVYGGATGNFGAATLIDYTVNPALDVQMSPYNYYFVTATDFSGNEGVPATVNPSSGVGGTPAHFTLSVSAHPNPFNPSTTVRYTIPARTHAELAVYDSRGARVATLVDRGHEAGAFTAAWDGRDARGEPAASGVYFARLATDAGTRSYKLVLVK